MQRVPFQTATNVHNEVKYLHAEKETSPVLVLFPAMGVRADFYIHLCKELCSKLGLHIALSDLRGVGKSSVRAAKGTDWGYKEMVEDFRTTIEIIRDRYKESNTFYLMGHSLGGQIACLCQAKYNFKFVKGIILAASCSVYYGGYSALSSKLATFSLTQSFNIIARLLGYLPGKKLGFGGLEAKSVIIDWSRQCRTGKYLLENDAFDYEAALKNCTINILTLSYIGDYLAPQTATKHLTDKFNPSSTIHSLELKNEATPYDHYNWAKNTNDTIQQISKWANNKNN